MSVTSIKNDLVCIYVVNVGEREKVGQIEITQRTTFNWFLEVVPPHTWHLDQVFLLDIYLYISESAVALSM